MTSRKGGAWTGLQPPWHVLGVGVGASPAEVKHAFRCIAKASHPDVLHATVEGATAAHRRAVLERGSERFRMAAHAYQMYDMQTGRWQPGLASSMVNEYAARQRQNRRRGQSHEYEKPPFDLRRFAAPRLHPKTRATVMGVYLCLTLGLAAESFLRSAQDDRHANRQAAPPRAKPGK